MAYTRLGLDTALPQTISEGVLLSPGSRMESMTSLALGHRPADVALAHKAEAAAAAAAVADGLPPKLEVTVSARQPSHMPRAQREARVPRTEAPERGSSWDSLSELALSLPSLTPWGLLRRSWTDLTLITGLAIRLYSYLGLGYKWFLAFYRLILFALLLMPGFIQMVVFYYFSPRVIRSIPYGLGPRQRLDLYVPKDHSRERVYPVVVFITGGAWTIGYKAWGALLARRLSSAGALVASLDYRNFPQGNARQMLEDVNTGIAWVCDKCERYQGDPDNVILVGQSAGAHLAALALLKQAEQASGESSSELGATPPWYPKDVRAFVGISGAYDLEGLAEHLHKRGMYKSLFTSIMSIDGVPALDVFSPLAVVRSFDTSRVGEASAAWHLPQVVLIHGTSDVTVPYVGSQQLHSALSAVGVDSTCKLVQGKSHTSFLLEGPMSGGQDVLMDTLLPLLQPTQADVVGGPPKHYPALCPTFLCNMAGLVCPF